MKSAYGSKINSFYVRQLTVSWRLIVVMALVLVAVAGFGATQTAFAVGPDPDGTNSASSSGAAGDIIFIPVAIANSSRGPLSYAEAPTVASNLPAGACGTASYKGGGQTVTGRINGVTEDHGTGYFEIDLTSGGTIKAFCTDIHHNFSSGNHCANTDFYSNWQVAWLVTHYPPDSSNSVNQAARQAAVWHFSDGFDLLNSGRTSSAVYTEYTRILNEIPAEMPPEYESGELNLQISPAYAVNPYSDTTHPFTVTLTKGGKPLAGVEISASDDSIYASITAVNDTTDSNGNAFFVLTRSNFSQTERTVNITANANVTLPAGSRFQRFSDNQWNTSTQRLVAGESTDVELEAKATKVWRKSDRLIVIHKYEDKNLDGVQNSGEPNLSNWRFTVKLDGVSKGTLTTDGNGNAYYTYNATDYGVFTIEETLLNNNWRNTAPGGSGTPTFTRTRSASDPWTYWQVNFGNARYSVIEVAKFLDKDRDGYWDKPGEPGLPGWTFALFDKSDGDSCDITLPGWYQLTGGVTGVDGAFGFTDLDACQYRVLEYAQPGYVNTTPMERLVTLDYPQYAYIEFGNVGSGSISGYKWNDVDGDGVWDTGEAGLQNWTIQLFQKTEVGYPATPDQTVTTGSDGKFEFTSLEPGTYKVCEVAQAGYSQTFPSTSGGCHEVTLDSSNNFTASLPIPGPTSATSTMANGGQMLIEFVGVSGNTWTYRLTEQTSGKDLSHWALYPGLCQEHVSSFTPTGASWKNGGLKWDVSGGFTTGEFSITMDASYPIGAVEAAVKGGSTESEHVEIRGPYCGVVPNFGNKPDNGKIIVKKATVPSGATDSFTFDPSWSTTNFNLTGGAQQEFTLPAGNYSVSELTLAGWKLDSAVCDKTGSTPAGINLQAGDVITCTFTNKKYGSLKVIKDAVPNDAQDFAFTTTGSGLSNFSLDDDANATLPNFKLFSNLSAGAYTVGEGAVSGWNLDSLVCTGAASWNKSGSIATINLDWGENAVCTYVNKKLPKVTIIKDAQPNDAQDFAFTTTGAGMSGFSLDDDADGVLSNTKVFSNLQPGAYSVTEGSVAGWTLTNLSCTGVGSWTPNSSTVSFGNLTWGDDLTCTFVNKKYGKIIVKKITEPGNTGQSFSFSQNFSGSPASFNLLDGGEQSFDVPAGSGYSVTENTPAGWKLDSAVCSDGSANTSISVEAGETVTCTFTNKKYAKLTVIKDAQPNDSQDFSYTATGVSPASFVLDDDADGTYPNTRVFSNLQPGSFTIEEAAVNGWTLGSLSCTGAGTWDADEAVVAGSLTWGDDLTCTYVNNKLGKITIVKDASPADGTEFDFTTANLPQAAFSLFDDDSGTGNEKEFTGLSQGVYTVTETTLDGWALTSLVCNQTYASVDLANGQSVIDLPWGGDVTCSYTNTKPGTITIIKVTEPDNDPQTFGFTSTGGLITPTFTLDDNSDAAYADRIVYSSVMPGAYSVTESDVAGWKLTNLVCSGDASTTPDLANKTASITIDAGESAVCTFTNTKLGKIIVIKDAQPDGATQFNFTVTGDGLTPFSLVDDGTGANNRKTFTDLLPGSYTINETDLEGWDKSVSCKLTSGQELRSPQVVMPVESDAEIDLQPGEEWTCTFTNVQRGKIIVNKVTQPAGENQEFGFSFDDPAFGFSDTFTLTHGASYDTGLIPAGSGYSVSENVATLGPEWALTDVDCGVGVDPEDITLDPGATVTCTFTNTKKGNIIVRKHTSPADDTTLFPFELSGPNGYLATTDISDGHQYDSGLLMPGSGYVVTETISSVSGWKLDEVICDDGEQSWDDLTVEPGETVTCDFFNDKLGRIIVIKDAQPDGPQQFDFILYGNGETPFSLVDDGSGVGNKIIFDAIDPGYYAIEELVPDGWDRTVECMLTGGEPEDVARVDILDPSDWELQLYPGQEWTCTFTNVKRGTIIVEKLTEPAGLTDIFEFTGDASGQIQSGGQIVVSELVPGVYTSTETLVDGFKLTDITCDDANSSGNLETAAATFQLDPGEVVKCTFTNTRLGAIRIIKNAIPDDAQDFGFNLTGEEIDPVNFTLDDDADATLSNIYDATGLLPGSYTVEELAQAGWDLTGLTCTEGGVADLANSEATIDLPAGGYVECTFTNTKLGSITIVKNAVPTGAQAFDFTTTGTGLSDFSLVGSSNPATNSITFGNLLPGAFTVTEEQLSGWDLTNLVCTEGGAANLDAGVASITLQAGASVTCTFTNTKFANIIVIKQTDPDGATQSFQFTPSWGAPFTLTDGQSNDSGMLQPGTYSVAETALAGWTLASATCSDQSSPASIQLDPGETVTCTFINNQQLGSLKITKTVLWDGTPDTTKTFEICITGPSFPGSLDCKTIGYNGGDLVWNDLIAGAYTISEMDPGENWTVTIENTEVVVPAGGQGTGTVENAIEPEVPGEKTPLLSSVKDDGLKIDVKGDGKVNAGDTLVYTVTIKNTGEGPATDVVFTDTPDENTTLVVGSVTASQGTVVKGNTAGDTSIQVNIGTIPALTGEVTIFFDVKINDPLDPKVTQVENQGVITSSNYPPFYTDDPTTPTPTDPTVTPIVEVPTAVGLINFYVLSASGSQITLAWSTAWEDANLGFYVYRAPQDPTTKAVDFTQATQLGFVNSKYPNGTAVGLAEYTYVDDVPANGLWYYWLVDVDARAKTSAQLDFLLSYRLGPAPVFIPMIVKPE